MAKCKHLTRTHARLALTVQAFLMTVVTGISLGDGHICVCLCVYVYVYTKVWNIIPAEDLLYAVEAVHCSYRSITSPC